MAQAFGDRCVRRVPPENLARVASEFARFGRTRPQALAHVQEELCVVSLGVLRLVDPHGDDVHLVVLAVTDLGGEAAQEPQ